jgi:hypothetical protein
VFSIVIRPVRIGRVAEGFFELGRIHGAVRAVGQGADARPDDDGVSGGLIEDHVVLAAGDRLLAAP